MSDLSIITINKKVICEPFKTVEIESKLVGGFSFIQQKINMVSLNVLHPFYLDVQAAPILLPQDIVWLDGEFIKANWATNIYEFHGEKCIIVPFDLIIAIQKKS